MMGMDPNLTTGAGTAPQGNSGDFPMGMNMSSMFQGMYPGMMNSAQSGQTPNNQ